MFATYRPYYHLLHQQPNFLHSHVNYYVQVLQIEKDYLVYYLKKKKNNIDLSIDISILRSPDDARLTKQRKGNIVAPFSRITLASSHSFQYGSYLQLRLLNCHQETAGALGNCQLSYNIIWKSINKSVTYKITKIRVLASIT